MTEGPRVVVVGLGPAGPELVDQATRKAIERIPSRFVRTRRHPAAELLAGDASFDVIYERGSTIEQVYRDIVDELVAAAERDGEVLYAVPGSPLVGERTVELLRTDERVEVSIRPALSFLDLVWDRLGVDPIASGVRVVDGQRFSIEGAGERGPLVVAQCDSGTVLSDVKLLLADSSWGDRGGSPPPITVLRRLGLADESVLEVAWPELDHVAVDHLTTLWIPAHAPPIANEVARFAELVATLRRECPWDREQTHESLVRHLVEETYEVIDAIEQLDEVDDSTYVALEEELGDVLFQIVFHATLAAEAGQFTLADVARVVHDKLYARHPHVFGDGDARDADDVVRSWEQIKKVEKNRTSVFDGIPSHLPSLLFALKVQKKAASLSERVDEGERSRIDDLLRAATAHPDAETIAALLFATTDLARRSGVDPESALRTYTNRRRDRWVQSEQQID
jgi:tetrapyrrole methylase family protein/MazG family protein